MFVFWIFYHVPEFVGFQSMVILDPYGMTLDAEGVFGLAFHLLFRSWSTYCDWGVINQKKDFQQETVARYRACNVTHKLKISLHEFVGGWPITKLDSELVILIGRPDKNSHLPVNLPERYRLLSNCFLPRFIHNWSRIKHYPFSRQFNIVFFTPFGRNLWVTFENKIIVQFFCVSALILLSLFLEMRIFDQICIFHHILEKFGRMKLNVDVKSDIFRERKNLEFGKMKNM